MPSEPGFALALFELSLCIPSMLWRDRSTTMLCLRRLRRLTLRPSVAHIEAP